MYQEKKIWFGASETEKMCILPAMANRHGLIAGATGTGKTTTLRVLAESFSDCGVPVFLADVKGDLAGMCKPGSTAGHVATQMEKVGLTEEDMVFHGCPTTYWDIYAEKGMPLRTTISEMGPLLLSRILGLNATQEAVLTVVFKIADDQDLLLIDTKDLRAMLTYVGENAKEFSLIYGNMAKATMAAIIRAVIALESEGGDQFFGEPALNIKDWIRKDEDGKGMINILDCQKLINSPTMYSTFLLWMLSELYENLPEQGDLDKPRIVFFFDEAHMLFDSASKALMDKIEQVVKLVRSKGVGIYFITQSPKDVPDGVLGQLGNKIQHALRAYTPAEQKKLKAVADSFRADEGLNTLETLQNMGIGEALVSVLDEKGIPTPAKKCVILPPQCSLGTLDDDERARQIQGNDLFIKYDESVDRDSAYEFLMRKNLEDQAAAEQAAAEAAAEKARQKEEAAAQKAAEKAAAAEEKAAQKAAEQAEKQRLKEEAAAQKAAEKAAEEKKKKASKVAKGIATTTGGTIGREVGNALGSAVGGKFGKKLGGNVGASLGRGILGSLFGK